MMELRDLKDLTIHNVQPLGDEARSGIQGLSSQGSGFRQQQPEAAQTRVSSASSLFLSSLELSDTQVYEP